jgi:alcohol dehydrogenase class IV
VIPEPWRAFEFAAPARIVFGAGVAGQLGPLTLDVGRRPLVVTGRDAARVRHLVSAIEQAGGEVAVVAAAGEPSTDSVTAGAALAKAHRADVIVAIGGGSALDTGKAIAALAANPGDLFDYLETIGRGQPLDRPAWPVVAVPTTAGTGSEATKNAVVSSAEHRVKVSLRHLSMLPRIAVVDPELALGLPSQVTATTGLDALTQLIEPFVCRGHNPVVDAVALDGIGRVARSLQIAVDHPGDLPARTDMALAALWSGLSLANAGLGAVHGIAGPLGGLLGAPHGALCAALLPHAMAVNLAAARRMGADAVVARYTTVARVLTGTTSATADAGVQWVRDVAAGLSIRGLAAYGLTPAAFPGLIDAARRASSMKGNPVELGDGEIGGILGEAR